MRTATTMALLLVACAAPTQNPSAGGAQPQAYPGKCQLLHIEQEQAEGDMWTDTAFLVATYSPGAGKQPVGMRFRVRTERVHELRAHLDRNAQVFCTPDPGVAKGDEPGFEIQVPPFEGATSEAFIPKMPAERHP